MAWAGAVATILCAICHRSLELLLPSMRSRSVWLVEEPKIGGALLSLGASACGQLVEQAAPRGQADGQRCPPR